VRLDDLVEAVDVPDRHDRGAGRDAVKEALEQPRRQVGR
jgi:hypothetical protein